MKRKWVAALLALGVASAAWAHHSFAMFDQNQVWTWEGQVVEYRWRQPHVHIIMLVPEGAKDPRTVGTWDVESSGPNIGSRQGWAKDTFKPGDKIIVVGNPKTDGTKGLSLKYAKTVDGRVLYHDVDRKVTPENTPQQ
ncbi:hypothetical protein HNQ60_005390 [Povalibacter uvarum]|uniref:DUF5666 domain-containing protein n=1 Tax=Povalibacter uvarum TaxID=732238 RepID=A0A841HX29_9GAMM|nr:DUF6152 family protein [Povalibacter uvarum]MBB6096468.1 hypothetical protein [Povalibacter uvarum]